MNKINKDTKKKTATKKVGREADQQTEMQQTASPRIDNQAEKNVHKVADQKKREETPGIPDKNQSKQAGSVEDAKSESKDTGANKKQTRKP